jgi:hypothetical protein
VTGPATGYWGWWYHLQTVCGCMRPANACTVFVSRANCYYVCFVLSKIASTVGILGSTLLQISAQFHQATGHDKFTIDFYSGLFYLATF